MKFQRHFTIPSSGSSDWFEVELIDGKLWVVWVCGFGSGWVDLVSVGWVEVVFVLALKLVEEGLGLLSWYPYCLGVWTLYGPLMFSSGFSFSLCSFSFSFSFSPLSLLQKLEIEEVPRMSDEFPEIINKSVNSNSWKKSII